MARGVGSCRVSNGRGLLPSGARSGAEHANERFLVPYERNVSTAGGTHEGKGTGSAAAGGRPASHGGGNGKGGGNTCAQPQAMPLPPGLFIHLGSSHPKRVTQDWPRHRQTAFAAQAAQADAATATPPATLPACAASSAALEAWGELASEGGTSCQNFCSELDQSARMALPLAEPAGGGDSEEQAR